MPQYIDTYIAGPTREGLESFAAAYGDYIPLRQGRAATAESTDADGSILPAMPACGDPSLYYTCVRSARDIANAIVSPMTVIDTATGIAVVGVFAS